MAKAVRKRARKAAPRRRRAEPKGAERRRAPRYAAGFEVDYRAEDTFLFAYISNLSELGIFLQTERPEPPGTSLLLRFQPPGFDHPLELSGRVMWINPPRERPEPSHTAGMGVQFVDLTAAQRGALMELVKRLAYLDDDAGGSDAS